MGRIGTLAGCIVVVTALLSPAQVIADNGSNASPVQIMPGVAAGDSWQGMDASGCGGNGQLACLEWDWCAWLDPIFGWCVPGFVPSGAYGGCNSDRLNNYFGFCGICGRDGAPICAYGPACDDRNRQLLLFCPHCGRNGELVCDSGAPCDPGHRNTLGFCSPSGYSEEPDCDCDVTTVPPQTPGEPVRGFADIHAHQFSNLGFGGNVLWGAPFDKRGINAALAWCDYTWDFSTRTSNLFGLIPGGLPEIALDTRGYAVHGDKWLQWVLSLPGLAAGEPAHFPAGTGLFDAWPNWYTVTHQQMYYKWLERAYKGGLRLMVMLATSNEVLCEIARTREGFGCDDMDAVDRQIQGAKALEAFIDKQNDGVRDGDGWYRIAYSAAHARRIIEEGDLAVVLGIEVDSLFGCKPLSTHCTDEYIRGELQRYYDQGVRHVYPIHAFDNKFGGAGLYLDVFSYANFIATGGLQQTWDCSELGYSYKIGDDDVPFLDELFAPLFAIFGIPNYGTREADCNARGLSEEGGMLLNAMMDQKMIIDVDHMSYRTMEGTLEIAEARDYPLVSGHPTYADKLGRHGSEYTHTADQLRRIRDLGGIVAANLPRQKCSSTRDYAVDPSAPANPDDVDDPVNKHSYRYIVNLMSGDDTGRTFSDQAYYGEDYPAIAVSTDFNGFPKQCAPRFGPDAEACEGFDADAPRLVYGDDGFEAVGGFGRFKEQQTGGRTFDFNEDGLAHVGLFPDLFADLLNVGFTEEDLDPIFNSAEVYLRMWERIDNSDVIPPPTIAANVQGIQGANGWYTSDVTVTWELLADDAIVSTTNCELVIIATDTPGITLTCQAATEGSSSQASVTIRRDTVGPVVTSAHRVTPEPPSGWTNAPVVVAFEAEDATSGLAGPAIVEVTLHSEGADLVATHTFTDVAGLTTVAEFHGINIDVTPPTVGFRFANLPPDATPEQYEQERLRWHNQDVVFNIDAIDALSGIASVSPTQLILTAEGTTVQGSATAIDLAGNSATLLSPPVKIDKTRPTIAYLGRTPAPNVNGWNNEDITATWACQDSLSGIVDAVVSETLTSEGEGMSLTGQCTDAAGNTADDTVSGLNLDKTAPFVACLADPPQLWPVNRRMVQVTVATTFTDELSGPAALTLTRSESNEPDTGTAPGDPPNDMQGFDLGSSSTSGALRAQRAGGGGNRVYTLGYTGSDLADNSATCTTQVIVPHDRGRKTRTRPGGPNRGRGN